LKNPDLQEAFANLKTELIKEFKLNEIAIWLTRLITHQHKWGPNNPQGRFEGPLRCTKCKQVKKRNPLELLDRAVANFWAPHLQNHLMKPLLFPQIDMISSPHVDKDKIYFINDYGSKMVASPEIVGKIINVAIE